MIPASDIPATAELGYGSWRSPWRPGLLLVLAFVFAGARLAPSFATAFPGSTGLGPTPELEWSWSLLGEGIGATGLFAADLDDDGTVEIVAANAAPLHLSGAGGHWFTIEYDGAARQTWSSLASPQPIVRLRPVEIGPGIDVAIATETSLLIVDGATKQVVRSIPGLGPELRDFLVIDVDADPATEIVVCTGGDLLVLDYTTLAPEGSLPGTGCQRVDAAQADADAQLEILVAGAPDGLVLDGESLAPDWSAAGFLGEFARFVDLDSDGTAELLGADPLGNVLRAIDLPSGGLLWDSAVASSTVEAIAPTLLVEPAGPRVLVGSSAFPTGLQALDALTGAQVWSVAVDSRAYRGLVVSDADQDGVPEALFGADRLFGRGERLAVVDLVAREVEHETPTFTAPLVGLAAGDTDADGDPELVTASRTADTETDGGRLLVLDPETRTLEYGQPDAEDGILATLASTAAQLDGDPQLELCTCGWYGVACRDGSSHEEEWSIQLPWGVEATALAAVDIDGDGRDELLLGSESGLVYALDGSTGWLEWRSPPAEVSGSVEQLRVANVIGGPREDVIATTRFFGGIHVAILDPANGRFIWRPVAFWGWSALGLAQIDGDPELDILLGNEGGDVAVLDLDTRSVGPPILFVGHWIHGITAADLGGGPSPELVIRDENRIRVYGGVPWTQLWASPYLGPVGSAEPLLVGNVDTDLDWEILALSRSSIAAFELAFPGLFADGFESGDTAAWSASAPFDDR